VSHGEPAPRQRPGLAKIFLAFLRIGSTGFGGSSVGWLYRGIVVRRRWIDDATFLSILAVGQALPGANGLKASVQIGRHLHGPLGATAALLGLLSGPFVIILVVAGFYRRLGDYRIVHAVLDGMAAGAIGLTFDTGLKSAVQGAPGPAALAIVAATVLSVGVLRWPMLPVLLVLAPLGVALALVQRRH
jgi:chromate transporter